MRSKLFVLSVGFAIGCGGGDSKPKLPDAKVFMDAAIDAAPVCTADAMLGNLNLMNTMPNDYFIIPMAGQANAGMKTLLIGGRLPSSTAAGADILAFEVVRPAAGYQTGTAYTFATALSNMYPAAAYVLGDLTQTDYAQLYWASSGSVTFTAVGEANGTTISGMVTAVNFREMNEMTSQEVPGGCTSSLGGLMFSVVHMDMPFNAEETEEGHGLTAGERAQVIKAIEKIKLAQQQ